MDVLSLLVKQLPVDIPVKIAIITRNGHFSESLAAILKQDKNVQVVASADDIAKICIIEELEVEVLLLDAGFGKTECMIIMDTIRILCPKIKTILISSYDEKRYRQSIMLPGVTGIIYANSERDAYIHTILQAKTDKDSHSPEVNP